MCTWQGCFRQHHHCGGGLASLYYVIVVPAGVSLLLPFSGLTLELFLFPDSDDLDSLPVRQLGPGSSFLFWLDKVEFLIISESV